MDEFIQARTFEEARKLIKRADGKGVLFSGINDELNRKVLEKEKIVVLLINLSERKDFQKQRSSGLNQVLAKLAKKKGVSIGINLDEIISSKEKSKILGRVVQNIEICKKYRVRMEFISKNYQRDKRDIKSLGLVLGMPTWMTKNL